MESKRQRSLLAASVAGLLAAGAWAGMVRADEDMGSDNGAVPCYGINKCKGSGDCGGKGNSCSGKNACKGQGFIELDKDDCLRIQGGNLTAPAAQ